MSKIIPLLFIAITFIFTGCSLDGTITDESGNPIADAKVVATSQNITQEVVTDKEGHYIVSDLTYDNNVSLIVSKTGFKTESKTFLYASNSNVIDFSLTPENNVEIRTIKGYFSFDNLDERRGYKISLNPKEVSPKLYLFAFVDTTDSRVEIQGDDSNETGFTFTINLTKTLDLSKKFTLKFDGAYEENPYLTHDTYTKDFIPTEYITDNSDVLDLGKISLEYISVKGCAQELDGSIFAKGKVDDGSAGRKFTPSINLDDLYGFKGHAIFDKDKGEFEFKVVKSDSPHTLTLFDADRNTKTIEFTTNNGDLDLRDSCIQVEKDSTDTKLEILTNDALVKVLYSNYKIAEELNQTKSANSINVDIKRNGIYNLAYTGAEEEASIKIKLLGKVYDLTYQNNNKNFRNFGAFQIYQNKLIAIK